MFSKAESAFAAILLVVCAVAGIVGYALTAGDDPPAKIWFDTGGGDVIFDHAFHASWAEDCSKCHHNAEEGETPKGADANCRACHYYGEAAGEVETDGPHPRAVGYQCMSCHEEIGDEAAQCAACHIRKGYAFQKSGRPARPMPKGRLVFEMDPHTKDAEARGKVRFDHDWHRGFLECSECHHAYDAEATGVAFGEKNCRVCHYQGVPEAKKSPAGPHGRFVGGQCVACHVRMSGEAKGECESCHIKPGDEAKRPDRALSPLPKSMIFEMDNDKGKRRGPVAFSHKYHMDLMRCGKCHHAYDPAQAGGKAPGEKNCRACHYNEIPKDKKSPNRTHPRFIGGNCRTCHKETLGKQMSKCDACHTKPDATVERPEHPRKPLPAKVVFKAEEGEVAFDHKLHVGEAEGACVKCHHTFKKAEGMKKMGFEKNCRACHYALADKIEDNEDDDNHARHIGASCTQCHDADECEKCHKE